MIRTLVAVKSPGLLTLIIFATLLHGAQSCLQNCTCSDHHTMTCRNLTTIPQTITQNVKTLIFQNADFNIPANLFSDSTYQTVTTLDFVSGHFDLIDSRAFVRLTELTTLTLEKNLIHVLQPDAFDDIPKMKHLILSGNNFNELVPGLFLGLTDLFDLQFKDHNSLEINPNAFRGLDNLKRLTLSGNHLKAIKDYNMWNGLNSLEYLDLSSNEMTEITDEIFSQLHTLKHLNLANNSLETLSQAKFAGLNRLEALVLYSNPLLFVPKSALRALPQLLLLNLQRTDIRLIAHDDFANVLNLKVLSLDYNPLMEVPTEALGLLRHLQYLNLRGTQISSLPSQAFVKLNNMTALAVSRSHLSEIHEDAFKGLPKLQNLDLSRNKLMFLPSKVFIPFAVGDQTKITLSGNPWQCDCHFGDFAHWALYYYSNATLHIVFKDLICETPPQLNGYYIWDVPADNFTCPPPRPKPAMSKMEMEIIIGSLVGSVLVVAMVTTAIMKYYRKRKTKVRRQRQRGVNLVVWDDNSEEPEQGMHNHDNRSTTSVISL